jgi:hypothetical protein
MMPLPTSPRAVCWLLLIGPWTCAVGEEVDRRQVIDSTMRPYDGPVIPGVDPSTLAGKVMCYQGWFSTPDDGAGRGWRHWGPGRCGPEACTVSLWPDISELTPAELHPTGFTFSDGRTASVFSSYDQRTVLRHFAWMRKYCLDGVFVQRFAIETIDPVDLRHRNVVLSHCREGANRNGRTYAVMYDLSGLPPSGIDRVIDDWKLLADRMRITADPAYQRHAGRPIVAVWGVGFRGADRKYSLADCVRLVEFLKHDPIHGGCAVMLGVPTYWRTLDGDAIADPALHALIAQADLVSPWTVGRYATLEEVARHADQRLRPDLQWCRERGIRFLPVVFPGFRWWASHPDAGPATTIPRQHGRFLWEQFAQLAGAGCDMAYVAMFDEVDEGTAIFKCTNDPPDARFGTFDRRPAGPLS